MKSAVIAADELSFFFVGVIRANVRVSLTADVALRWRCDIRDDLRQSAVTFTAAARVVVRLSADTMGALVAEAVLTSDRRYVLAGQSFSDVAVVDLSLLVGVDDIRARGVSLDVRVSEELEEGERAGCAPLFVRWLRRVDDICELGHAQREQSETHLQFLEVRVQSFDQMQRVGDDVESLLRDSRAVTRAILIAAACVLEVDQVALLAAVVER